MLRIAVLGCGRIGRMHAENIALHPRADLAGVFDVHAPSATDVAESLNVTAFGSAEEAIAAPGTDAVLIATPTDTHVGFIEACVAAGKPVLCEKPIDLSLQRVRACADRVGGSEVPIMIGFCRRFDAGHRAARQALHDGELGELHQVVITSRDPGMAPDGYIRTSGGIFRDMTIHDLDLARYMLGEEIAAVSAQGSRKVNPALMEECGDYDTVVVTLVSETGKQAIIINSREAVYGYDQRVELFGSGGMAISDNQRDHLARKYLAHGTGIAAPLQHFFIERYKDAFFAEIDSFVDAVAGQTPLEVSFDDGLKALELAEACNLSVAEGRTVKLSELE